MAKLRQLGPDSNTGGLLLMLVLRCIQACRCLTRRPGGCSKAIKREDCPPTVFDDAVRGGSNQDNESIWTRWMGFSQKGGIPFIGHELPNY